MLLKVFCPTTLVFPCLVFFSAVPPNKQHKWKHSSGLRGACCTSGTTNSQRRRRNSVFPLAGICSIPQQGSFDLPCATLEHLAGWFCPWSCCSPCGTSSLSGRVHLAPFQSICVVILLQCEGLSGLIMPFWDMELSIAC